MNFFVSGGSNKVIYLIITGIQSLMKSHRFLTTQNHQNFRFFQMFEILGDDSSIKNDQEQSKHSEDHMKSILNFRKNFNFVHDN